MRQLWRWPIKLLRGLWIGLVGLVLIFEEWGWEPLARLLAWIGDLPGLRWIEGRIRALPPYAALALFLLPVLTLFPIKLLALYWLSQGHTVLGVSTILLAKLAGTAITARLFMLTRPTLMRLAWFARWFNRWISWKDKVVAQVKASAGWQAFAQFREGLRQTAKALVARIQAWFS